MAFADVASAAVGVLVLGHLVRLDLAGGGHLIEILLQERPAPAAAGASAKALADLADAARLLHAQEVDNLPLADVKAQTDFVVEVQGVVRGEWRVTSDEPP